MPALNWNEAAAPAATGPKVTATDSADAGTVALQLPPPAATGSVTTFPPLRAVTCGPGPAPVRLGAPSCTATRPAGRRSVTVSVARSVSAGAVPLAVYVSDCPGPSCVAVRRLLDPDDGALRAQRRLVLGERIGLLGATVRRPEQRGRVDDLRACGERRRRERDGHVPEHVDRLVRIRYQVTECPRHLVHRRVVHAASVAETKVAPAGRSSTMRALRITAVPPAAMVAVMR